MWTMCTPTSTCQPTCWSGSPADGARPGVFSNPRCMSAPEISSRPPVVILCGGRGTRLQEHTQEIPKPLVEIGGRPIVWHVIQLYAVQGFRKFVLATGYKGELIERFVAECEWPDGVSVECEDTGLETPTGGRI